MGWGRGRCRLGPSCDGMGRCKEGLKKSLIAGWLLVVYSFILYEWISDTFENGSRNKWRNRLLRFNTHVYFSSSWLWVFFPPPRPYHRSAALHSNKAVTRPCQRAKNGLRSIVVHSFLVYPSFSSTTELVQPSSSTNSFIPPSSCLP